MAILWDAFSNFQPLGFVFVAGPSRSPARFAIGSYCLVLEAQRRHPAGAGVERGWAWDGTVNG